MGAHLDDVEGKASSTVRKVFQLAASVLDRAVVLRMLSANPARTRGAVDLPSAERREMRFLSVEEVYKVADCIEGRCRVLILTAAFTGLRWGELAGLKSAYLDRARRRFTVNEVRREG